MTLRRLTCVGRRCKTGADFAGGSQPVLPGAAEIILVSSVSALLLPRRGGGKCERLSGQCCGRRSPGVCPPVFSGSSWGQDRATHSCYS